MINNTNVSMRAVKSVLMEKANDLWGLCNSPNINKWAKYSPKTAGGTIIPFSTLPAAKPFELGSWKYTDRTASPAKLGDFRNYHHEAVEPVILGFPSEFYCNFPTQFTIGITPKESNNICLQDVFNSDGKYFGVAIRQKNKPQNYIWGTTETPGATQIDVDLSQHKAWFPAGQVVEVIFFYCNSKKKFEDPDLQTDFWSLMCEPNVQAVKEFTLKSFAPPVTYEQIIIENAPLNGNWSYDELSFDDISIKVKGKVQANYRLGIKVITSDGKYYNDYAMLRDVTVNAGETVTVLSTGLFYLPFYNQANMAFIQVLNLKDNNKIIAEKPILKTDF